MTVKVINIAIIGGNYGGLGCAQNLVNFIYGKESLPLPIPKPKINIRLYDKRRGFVHLIGMTRALTGHPIGPTLFTPHEETSFYKSGQVTFIHKKVVEVYKNYLVTEDGNKDEFDYLVLATGYNRPPPIWPAAKNKDEMITELDSYAKRLEAAEDVIVVGGGAVGVELSCDIASHFPGKKVTLVHSRELPIPGPFSDEFRHKVVDILKDYNVKTIFGNRLKELNKINKEGDKDKYELITNKDLRIQADMVIQCTGFGSPSSELLKLAEENPAFEGQIQDSKGLVQIRKTLQLLPNELSHIFAIGDVNNFQEIKLAGGAMYQGMYAARSICALINAESGSIPKLEEYPQFFQHLYLLLGPEKVLAWDEKGILTQDTMDQSARYLLHDMGRDVCKAGLGFEVDIKSEQ